MSKLIAALVILLVLWGGWLLFDYYQKVSAEEYTKKQSTTVVPSQLPGMPGELEGSLSVAQSRGAGGLRDWLAAYGSRVQDPRLAWIQLDYVALVGRSEPAEARKVFNAVRQRVKPDSPVYDRVKQLEPTYQ